MILAQAITENTTVNLNLILGIVAFAWSTITALTAVVGWLGKAYIASIQAMNAQRLSVLEAENIRRDDTVRRIFERVDRSEKESQDAIAKLGNTVAKLCSAVAALDATLKASIAKQ